MKILLERSWTNVFGRKYPIGQTIPCDRQLGNFLIDNGYGKEINGKAPLKTKSKTKMKK